jgi:hypothetical protein
VVNAIEFKPLRARILSFLALVLLTFTSSGQELELLMDTEPESRDFGNVIVKNLGQDDLIKLSEEGKVYQQSVLSIFTGASPASDVPPVLGSYSTHAGILIFKPRFPPVPGKSYLVRVNLGNQSIEKVFNIPDIDFPKTQVRQIFPAMDTLPSNLLRFYIYFSQPMGLEDPYQHISILDQENEMVKEPFVEVREGLWDPERKRLTLFIHPGRIKRGVGPHNALGPVFERGKTYSLVIDSNWRDSNGQAIENTQPKTFYVGPAIREKLQISSINTDHIRNGTHSAVKIKFDAPVDHSLAKRMIQVYDSNRNPVEGSISQNGNEIFFNTINTWNSDNYIVLINRKLEDISGNTLYYIFDTELNQGSMSKSGEDLSIEFSID